MDTAVKFIDAGVLQVAYHRFGEHGSPVVVLMHGFPYDVHSYSDVAPQLATQGFDVIVPYMRGYGPTRFLDTATTRSGEQAGFGDDLLGLLDALNIEQAVLAGYDWGGRAACVVAALWPQRVRALVSCAGYNIQNIAASLNPAQPSDEYRHWYQYYFHSQRGRTGLTQNRRDIARLLWQLWSPDWRFDDDTFVRTAKAFDNADYVDVVIHSYRHRFGLVPGDPRVAEIQRKLATLPQITVPTVIVDGESDGVMPSTGYGSSIGKFTGPCTQIALPSVGHNPPQEAPNDFVAAILQAASFS